METAESPDSSPSLDERLQRVTPAERTSRAFLLVVDGPTAGRLHLLGEEDRIIGRGDKADIKLDDPLVSHEHARITRRGDAYYLVDLGSRNGTILNGARVSESRLRSKDRLRIATTTVIFLEEDRNEATQTIVLHDEGPLTPRGAEASLGVGSANYYVDAPGRALPPAPEENPAVELLRQLIKIAKFVWRNRWTLIPLPLLGLALGVYSIFRFPAPETAQAVVKLSHVEQENPMDQRGYGRSGPPKVFFEDPERNFRSQDLASKTLATMGAPENASTVAKSVQGLSIEGDQDGLYVATFSQPSFGGLPISTVGFLEQYLDNYLVSEVDKQIRVLKSEASFLENELKQVEGELHDVEQELLDFRREHIDSLPEQAGAAISGQQQLAMRRAELELEVERMSMEAANARERLKKPETTLVRRFEDTRPLQNEIQSKEQALGTLKAQGLKADHPEVSALTKEISELKSQLNAKLNSGVSEMEDRADPRQVALRQEVAASEGNLRVARKALERVNQQLGAASGKVAEVPEVEATVLRLTRGQESLMKLRAQLFDQHRKAQVQIDLETANVRARYEVVSQARLVDPLTKKFLGMRLGGGFGAGLLVALLITGALETRRLVRQHPELLKA